MTFSSLKAEIKERLLYTSDEADARVGRLINKIYRQIGTSIGMSFSRQTSTTKVTTVGSADVIFSATEKVLQVWRLDGNANPTILIEVLPAELRERVAPSSDKPTKYAIISTTSNSVTIRLDAKPATAYTLYADIIAEVVDLSGINEPAFPESFHDVIIEGVLKDEYLKLEKIPLARESEGRYERRLSDLRMFVIKSNYLDIVQGKLATDPSTRNTGGSSASFGNTALLITGLWTFDRDPSAPFTVTSGSAYVPNLYAEKLGNITTDRLIGRDTTGTGESEQLIVSGGIEFSGTGGIQTSAFTGDVTKGTGGTVTTIASDVVTYAKMQNATANVVLTRAASSSGDIGETALAASQLLGRGSSGDIAAITLGSGLTMSTTTLSASASTADDAQNILANQVFGI